IQQLRQSRACLGDLLAFELVRVLRVLLAIGEVDEPVTGNVGAECDPGKSRMRCDDRVPGPSSGPTLDRTGRGRYSPGQLDHRRVRTAPKRGGNGIPLSVEVGVSIADLVAAGRLRIRVEP